MSALCKCGCGHPAPIAKRTNAGKGHMKGQAVRFVLGHNIARPAAATDPVPNPSGACECGCGRKTPMANVTDRSRGWIKGQPIRFCLGHSGGPEPFDGDGPNLNGKCTCGCGEQTPIASCSDRTVGNIKGKPQRYVPGHQRRRQGPAWIEDPVTGCHLWQGSRDGNGYGLTTHNGKVRRAHIVRYEAKYGPVPEGKELDHFRCDNPPCCNPDHVRPVTHAENVQRGPNVVLTLEQAQAIRTLLKTPGAPSPLEVAAMYGVTRRTIYDIRLGNSWREPQQIAVSRGEDGLSRVEVVA